MVHFCKQLRARKYVCIVEQKERGEPGVHKARHFFSLETVFATVGSYCIQTIQYVRNVSAAENPKPKAQIISPTNGPTPQCKNFRFSLCIFISNAIRNPTFVGSNVWLDLCTKVMRARISTRQNFLTVFSIHETCWSCFFLEWRNQCAID